MNVVDTNLGALLLGIKGNVQNGGRNLYTSYLFIVVSNSDKLETI